MKQLKSCEIRYTVLASELQEVSLQGQLLVSRRNKVRHGAYLFHLCLYIAFDVILPILSASEHLLAERAKLDKKIQYLQEERQLLEQHLEGQQTKQRRLEVQHLDNEKRLSMVRDTLHSVQVEMDKLRLLVQGMHGT